MWVYGVNRERIKLCLSYSSLMKKEIKLLLHNLIDKEMFLFLHPCNTQTLERKDRNVERDGEMPAAFNYLSNPNVVN